MTDQAPKRRFFFAGWQIALIILVLLSGLGYLLYSQTTSRYSLYGTPEVSASFKKIDGLKFSSEAHPWATNHGGSDRHFECLVEDDGDSFRVIVPHDRVCYAEGFGENSHPEVWLTLKFYRDDPEHPGYDEVVNETRIRAAGSDPVHFDLKLTDDDGNIIREIDLKNDKAADLG